MSLDLPVDDKPSRIHRAPKPAPDDVLDTLREYERLARTACPSFTIASRFTADGETWVPVWLSENPPAAVRTAIVRDGVTTDEYRSWAESRPADDEGRERWDANPSTFLRAFTERAALRRAFADVIVGRRDAPSEPSLVSGPEAAVMPTPAVVRPTPVAKPTPTSVPRKPQPRVDERKLQELAERFDEGAPRPPRKGARRPQKPKRRRQDGA